MRPLPFSFSAVTASAAVLLATPGVSQARLGESPEECALRYGKIVAETNALLPGAASRTFIKNKVRVRVEFLNDKAVFISFTKRSLKSDERQSLLMLNSGNLRWSVQDEHMGRKFWVAREGGEMTENRQASEYFFGDVGVLEIAGQSWLDAMKQQQMVMLASAMTSGAGTSAVAPTGENVKAAASEGTAQPVSDPDNPDKRVGSGTLEGF